VTSPVRLPITCPKYEPVPGTKRCRHYHANGACGLPDEFMCVEWLKANGHATPAPVTPVATSVVGRDLFGNPVTQPPSSVAPSRAARVEAPAVRREEVPIVRSLTDADIASFKALGLEVRLATEEVGDVWIVPAYTGADRHELSVDHAALIAAVASAFPGARVTSLVRKPKPPVPS
jgi:hypothetical protein